MAAPAPVASFPWMLWPMRVTTGTRARRASVSAEERPLGSFKRRRSSLMASRPDVIGFSILHANRWGGIEIAAVAKALNPDVKIVFGGIGATFLWHHLLKHFQAIDYIVIGEGEATAPRMLDAAPHVHGLSGVVTRDGPGPKPELLDDLDRFKPARDLTHRRRRYFIGILDL